MACLAYAQPTSTTPYEWAVQSMPSQDQHFRPSLPRGGILIRETVVVAVGIHPNAKGKFDLALVHTEDGRIRTFYRDRTDPRYGASLYFDWIEEYIVSVLGRRCFSAQIPIGMIMVMIGETAGVRFAKPEDFEQPEFDLTAAGLL